MLLLQPLLFGSRQHFPTFYFSHCSDTAIGIVHGIASCSGSGYECRTGVVVVVVVKERREEERRNQRPR
jgi:hypothetical protein